MAGRFCAMLDCVDIGFIPGGLFDELPLPSQTGATRTGGIDVNKPRSRAALSAALALAITPGGFTALPGAPPGDDGPVRRSRHRLRMKHRQRQHFVDRVPSRGYAPSGTSPGRSGPAGSVADVLI